MKWPDDYWPSSPEPPSAAAWDESVRAYKEDRQALQKLAADTSVDLEAKIPHGDGQTYMRELVLVIDHTAYHVGQLVLVRRCWVCGRVSSITDSPATGEEREVQEYKDSPSLLLLLLLTSGCRRKRLTARQP